MSESIFTPEQSIEIDARIEELVRLVIGGGEYLARWQHHAAARALATRTWEELERPCLDKGKPDA